MSNLEDELDHIDSKHKRAYESFREGSRHGLVYGIMIGLILGFLIQTLF